MRLSVVLAVRDGEAHLSQAIESVLAQSYTDFEFLIVDDGSIDSTPAILRQYQRRDSRIRVLTNRTSLGPYPSANRALGQARGDVIARHDADDISPPDRFRVQIDALDSGPDVTLVTGGVEVFTDDVGSPTWILRPPEWQPQLEWDLLFTNAIGAGSQVMFPRVLRDRSVLFPTRERYAEDYGLWCELARTGRVVSPSAVIYRYRQHPSSISTGHRAEQLACASRIRHRYQCQYLPASTSETATAEATKFWTRGDRRMSREAMRRASALLADLRAGFLSYVTQRYNAEASVRLTEQLDREVGQRLSYWLFRSMCYLDYPACRDVIRIARARHESVSVTHDALRQLVSRGARKMRQATAAPHS